MIAELPVDRGASQLALAFSTPPPTPLTAIPILGAEETVRTTGPVGVTTFDAAEKPPVPMALTAATRKLYAVPLLRVLMVVERTLPTGTVRTTVAPIRTRPEAPVI